MSLALATMVLARQAAIKAAKRQFQAQGLKTTLMPHRVIVTAAEDYLRSHPELIAEAKETALRWQAEGLFGRAKLRTSRQRAKA